MQRSIRRFSFLNDLWDSIDIIGVEERKMKKLVLTMLSIAGMMLFTALPAKACTSYYVGKDCTKDGTTMYGRTEDISSRKDKVYKVIQAKHVGKNAVYKDESGATEFQAPIKVDTTYRYTICRDNEGDEDGYFGEFGTNSKGVTMSATTSASAAKSIRQYDPYVKNTGITEENLTDYILCQASTAREGVEILADVMDTIGAGEGNGLFIADKNEVWYFEMLLGHNYCAIKMPSNKAAVIPNCLVIGDVDLSDKENVIASPNLGKIAKEEYGIALTFHHHMGTVVQDPDEVERMMANTDPEYVSLLFDTGHFTYCGADPLEMVKKYVNRIKHVHLKDIRPEVVKEVKDNDLSFLEGVRRGAFTVPGDGCIDFDPIFKVLEENGYEGYMLVEAEQDPAKANPLEYAIKARKFIREKTGL